MASALRKTVRRFITHVPMLLAGTCLKTSELGLKKESLIYLSTVRLMQIHLEVVVAGRRCLTQVSCVAGGLGGGETEKQK